MNPEQRIFTAIRTLCVELFGNEKVYDYTPPERAGYPFVHIGEQSKQNIRMHKRHLSGDTQVLIHFWHNNERQRGTFTKMMDDVETALIERYGVDGEQINTQVLKDNSTAVTLLHGVMEINIKNYK